MLPVTLLLVPYECSSTYIKGSNRAPLEIADLLPLALDDTVLLPERPPKFTIAFDRSLVCSFPDPRRMLQAVKDRVNALHRQGHFVVTIGGEHLVTLGVIQAYRRFFPNLSVLQLDAHADLRNSYEDLRYSHACVMRRIREIPGLNVLQVGIRSLSAPEGEYIQRNNIPLVFSNEYHHSLDWMEQRILPLPDPVFLTIDMDFFDPSVVPGVGTPEPHGSSWNEALRLFDFIAAKKTIIGFDVMELCPSLERTISLSVAIRMILYILQTIGHKDTGVASSHKHYPTV